MEKIKGYKIFFLLISIGGVLFSGYMSVIKMFSSVCAFGETCPLFLGFPACYYGFAIFLLLFIFSVILFFSEQGIKCLANLLLLFSLLGVIFASYFSLGELPLFFKNGPSAYFFGLPTCVMGCLFFILIFIASIFFRKKI